MTSGSLPEQATGETVGTALRCTTFPQQDRSAQLGIDRYQFDVQIPEHFERAMQGRLIRHPSDKVGLAAAAPADLESVKDGDRGQTQPSFHDDVKTLGCIQY